jgi:hypothetical protein
MMSYIMQQSTTAVVGLTRREVNKVWLRCDGSGGRGRVVIYAKPLRQRWRQTAHSSSSSRPSAIFFLFLFLGGSLGITVLHSTPPGGMKKTPPVWHQNCMGRAAVFFSYRLPPKHVGHNQLTQHRVYRRFSPYEGVFMREQADTVKAREICRLYRESPDGAACTTLLPDSSRAHRARRKWTRLGWSVVA